METARKLSKILKMLQYVQEELEELEEDRLRQEKRAAKERRREEARQRTWLASLLMFMAGLAVPGLIGLGLAELQENYGDLLQNILNQIQAAVLG